MGTERYYWTGLMAHMAYMQPRGESIERYLLPVTCAMPSHGDLGYRPKCRGTQSPRSSAPRLKVPRLRFILRDNLTQDSVCHRAHINVMVVMTPKTADTSSLSDLRTAAVRSK